MIHGKFGNLPRSKPWNLKAERASPSAALLAWFSRDYHGNFWLSMFVVAFNLSHCALMLFFHRDDIGSYVGNY